MMDNRHTRHIWKLWMCLIGGMLLFGSVAYAVNAPVRIPMIDERYKAACVEALERYPDDEKLRDLLAMEGSIENVVPSFADTYTREIYRRILALDWRANRKTIAQFAAEEPELLRWLNVDRSKKSGWVIAVGPDADTHQLDMLFLLDEPPSNVYVYRWTDSLTDYGVYTPNAAGEIAAFPYQTGTYVILPEPLENYQGTLARLDVTLNDEFIAQRMYAHDATAYQLFQCYRWAEMFDGKGTLTVDPALHGNVYLYKYNYQSPEEIGMYVVDDTGVVALDSLESGTYLLTKGRLERYDLDERRADMQKALSAARPLNGGKLVIYGALALVGLLSMIAILIYWLTIVLPKRHGTSA